MDFILKSYVYNTIDDTITSYYIILIEYFIREDLTKSPMESGCCIELINEGRP